MGNERDEPRATAKHIRLPLLIHPPPPPTERDPASNKVELCLTTEDMPVLHAASMSVCAMCPNAEERFDAHDEGRSLQVGIQHLR